MTVKLRTATFALLGVLTASVSNARAEVDLSKLPAPADRKGVTYEKDIRPLFEASCIRCHGADKPKAGLRLDNLEGVIKGTKEGKVVIAGKSKESPLVLAVSHLDEEMAMPPKPKPGRGGPGGGPGKPPGPPPKPLTPEQVGLVRAWIDQGAK